MVMIPLKNEKFLIPSSHCSGPIVQCLSLGCQQTISLHCSLGPKVCVRVKIMVWDGKQPFHTDNRLPLTHLKYPDLDEFWEQFNVSLLVVNRHSCFPLHSWLRGSMGFEKYYKWTKVDPSFSFNKTHQTRNFALFDMVMTQILHQQKFNPFFWKQIWLKLRPMFRKAWRGAQ